jgi:hypothetical protein
MRYLGSLWGIAVLASILCMPGCGSSQGPLVGGNNKAQISLTIHDSPPLGITILSLQVTVKTAMLQPGNVSITLPETAELTQLQSDTTILSSLQIPAGTYTSLVLDIENPSMTFINNTGGPITPFQGQTCAINAVCQITPVTNGNIVTFSTAPVFPLVLAPNEEAGLELDFDLADLVQSNLSLNFSNALNLTQLASVQGAAEIRRLRHVLGTVKLVQANFFSFTTPTGVLMGITTDGNTTFSFGAGCLANNFSCVKAGQVLELDISLEGNGTLLAKQVDLEADVNAEEISGVVVVLGAGSPPTTFQMFAHQASPAASVVVGSLLTITIGSPTTFTVDNHSFVLPVGLTFTGAASLLVGQELLSGVTFTTVPIAAITTSSIALRRSQVTALVFTAPTVGGTSFVLNPLPSLFQTALPTNITSLKVETTAQTNFENLNPNSIAGVTLGENVSVGGFLFNTQPAPGTFTIAVDAVRGQPLPGP